MIKLTFPPATRFDKPKRPMPKRPPPKGMRDASGDGSPGRPYVKGLPVTSRSKPRK